MIKRIVTLEELEKFENSLDVSYWRELYKSIRENFEIYKKIIREPKNIKLSLGYSKDITNIYYQKNEIKINKHFITYIVYYLYENSKRRDSLIFKSVNEKLYNNTLNLMIGFIIEFIILHELFHAKGNHLIIKNKFREKNIEFEEAKKAVDLLFRNSFKLCSKKHSLIETNIELDADKKAIELLLEKYLRLSYKNDTLIEKYIYAILHLTNIFKYLGNNNDNIKVRQVFLMASIVDLKRKIPSCTNISIEELENIKDICVIKFNYKYKDLYDFKYKDLELNHESVKEFFAFRREYHDDLNNNSCI
ncbi:hypothetical protein KO488_04555 [Poseidonibacter lekithochrous]|uniref:hypothetical protein n=1 Tax=Poseidonibacter TaxID=2321187 RepID=UPI001C090E8D|nr:MULTISPECIES: hypothetical protein [Poseidonibacter]MBU3014018.1 hypothetical protein [Poseidonibacter lekithochrous]MDO6827313.1 hypothetical protein [Poseidonibacter sp. 1_MG-2023]